ncbi:LysR family transcriptional regulator [Roseibium sp. SCP14]|uniref:LysR family transcriptional regulator n=1 Tax=Roseibium sp. SCP14 TaxID=3141375 RepID=UPI003339118A
MDIRQLRYFLEIVEHGSLTRASAHLNVAQPALSLHLKNMEEQLGTRLLNRSRAGVTPTEAGKLLVLRARTILNDLARTEDDIRNLESDPMGTVRIGIPGTLSGMIALPLIMAARERYPRITINIAEAMSGFIADWLSEGRVDIALLYSRSHEEGVVSELLLEEELVVLWQGEADAPDDLDLSELENIPLVLPSPPHGLRHLVDRKLAAIGLEPTIAIEIDSYSNIKRLVSAGIGASILPRYAVQDELEAGQLRVSRISAPGLWRDAFLLYPSDRPVTRAQEAIRDLLRDVIADLLATGAWAAARAADNTTAG